ncbi:MAG: HNH endonuclease [Clostridiales Family XIII bacterium]|jgi:5-methylcytosine-specific restriction endonuclease McrA|nr:HNH endonuclease [Clostridiales Family XIII bacterium]
MPNTDVPKRTRRADEEGPHRVAFEKNKKRIYAGEAVCGICGQPVDKSLRFPHPMSKCVDHIIPINRGGHPSDMENLQLAHLSCNRAKSDKIKLEAPVEKEKEFISNRILPWSINWHEYRG